MDWIESLDEPLTKLDVAYGVLGYVLYTLGVIIIEIGTRVYKITRKE